MRSPLKGALYLLSPVLLLCKQALPLPLDELMSTLSSNSQFKPFPAQLLKPFGVQEVLLAKVSCNDCGLLDKAGMKLFCVSWLCIENFLALLALAMQAKELLLIRKLNLLSFYLCLFFQVLLLLARQMP